MTEHQTLRVLLIEDNPDDVVLILRELRRANGYRIVHHVARTATEIQEALVHQTFDLIICDYFLESYDAPRVLGLLEHLGIDVPFILVSGKADQDLADTALGLRGVHEFVNKNRLSRLGPVIHRELRLYNGYDAIIKTFTRILELRDLETSHHAERVTDLTVRLARRMGIAESEIVHIRRGAMLHDIGKIGIKDEVLLKPGPLTDDERVTMQGHPLIGFELIKPVEILQRSLEIPLYHHEKWNGTGYPLKLTGAEIPLPARIFAVVDVYDALVSDRTYHEAITRQGALAYIKEQSGIAFDPAVVQAFLDMIGDL